MKMPIRSLLVSLIAGGALGLGVTALAQWEDPTADPTGGNPAPPIRHGASVTEDQVPVFESGGESFTDSDMAQVAGGIDMPGIFSANELIASQDLEAAGDMDVTNVITTFDVFIGGVSVKDTLIN